MKQLPLILVIVLSSGLFLWNFRRYEVAHAAESERVASSSRVGHEGGRGPSEALAPDQNGRSQATARTRDLDEALHSNGVRVALAAPEPVVEIEPPVEEPEAEPEPTDPIAEQVVLLLPNGEVRSEGATVDGAKHGRWLEWWGPEKPLSDGAYEYGRRQGPWTYWYENGEVMERGSYKDDLPEGPWSSQHANGGRKLAVTYSSGLKDGPMFEWAEDGSPVRQGHYASGQPDGRWVESNPDGTPRSETYYLNGVRHGLHRAWYTDGQLREQGEYIAGKREGRWLFYDPNGRTIPLRSGYYENGHRHRP